jgi:hypothetical protein
VKLVNIFVETPIVLICVLLVFISMNLEKADKVIAADIGKNVINEKEE